LDEIKVKRRRNQLRSRCVGLRRDRSEEKGLIEKKRRSGLLVEVSLSYELDSCFIWCRVPCELDLLNSMAHVNC